MSDWPWTLILVVGGLIAVATLVGAIVLAVKMWQARKKLGDLGKGGKVAFWGSLAYTIFPVDLLPDPIYLDDMGVLGLALFYLTRLAMKRRDIPPAYRVSGPPPRR
jgi:uncharacterized membrane protein YkvA (DUF1232 family)